MSNMPCKDAETRLRQHYGGAACVLRELEGDAGHPTDLGIAEAGQTISVGDGCIS